MFRFKSLLFAVIFIFLLTSRSIIYAKEPATAAASTKESLFIHAFSSSWTPLQLSCAPVSLFHDKADIYGINIALWLGTFPTDVYGLNYSTIANFVWGKHCGLSISCIWLIVNSNYGITAAPANMTAENHGLMLGIVNIGPMGDTVGNGIQIGLINQAESGLQIGLINYNKHALLPWMPLLNWSWAKPGTKAE